MPIGRLPSLWIRFFRSLQGAQEANLLPPSDPHTGLWLNALTYARCRHPRVGVVHQSSQAFPKRLGRELDHGPARKLD